MVTFRFHDFMSDYFCHRVKQNPSSHFSLRKKVTRRVAVPYQWCLLDTRVSEGRHRFSVGKLLFLRATSVTGTIVRMLHLLRTWSSQNLPKLFLLTTFFTLLFLSCKFGFIWVKVINLYFPVKRLHRQDYGRTGTSVSQEILTFWNISRFGLRKRSENS